MRVSFDSLHVACVASIQSRLYHLRHVILRIRGGALMNYPKSLVVTLVVISFVPNSSFAQSPAAKRGHPIKKESFGQTRDGKPVELYTVTNSHGMEVGAINYGGIIVSPRVPDKNGKLDDVV